MSSSSFPDHPHVVLDYRPDAIRRHYPKIVGLFEDERGIDSVFRAIVASAFDEESAIEALSLKQMLSYNIEIARQKTLDAQSFFATPDSCESSSSTALLTMSAPMYMASTSLPSPENLSAEPKVTVHSPPAAIQGLTLDEAILIDSGDDEGKGEKENRGGEDARINIGIGGLVWQEKRQAVSKNKRKNTEFLDFAWPLFLETAIGGGDTQVQERRQAHVLASKDLASVSKENGRIPDCSVEPCVTPLIANIAHDMFHRRLEVTTTRETNGSIKDQLALEGRPMPTVQELQSDSTVKIAWKGASIGNVGPRTYYHSIMLEGEVITVGDSVYIRGEGEEVPWVGKILYFFEHESDMFCHVRYFHRGGDTILEEMAAPRELFLADYCQDEKLEVIIRRVEILHIEGDSCPSPDVFYYRFWYSSDRRTCVFEEAIPHEELTPELQQLCQEHEPCPVCARFFHISAEITTTTTEALHESVLSIKHRGITYHQNDFVYLNGVSDPLQAELAVSAMTTTDVPKPYLIGQVIGITRREEQDREEAWVEGTKDRLQDRASEVSVLVQLFIRHDDLLDQPPAIQSRVNRIQPPLNRDNRRLVWTTVQDVFTADRLRGKCRVRFLSEQSEKNAEEMAILNIYRSRSHAYYYKETLLPDSGQYDLEGEILKGGQRLFRIRGQGPCDGHKATSDSNVENFLDGGDATLSALGVKHPIPCGVCRGKDEEDLAELDQFLNSVPKLRTMDVFSGCGGLSLGLEQSGVVETHYAIDFFPCASRTFKMNFPDATFYNENANIALRRAIRSHAGEDLPPKTDRSGLSLPSMPSPGEVDMIVCGPPCQGFSGLNNHKREDDPRNSLVATALSYVDFYRPQVFLLENVQGLLYHKSDRGEDTVSMVMVKFIARSLTKMGYQFRIKVLEAGQYGVPQSRRRVFIWASRLAWADQSISSFKGLSSTLSFSSSLWGQKFDIRETPTFPLPEFPVRTTCFPRRSRLFFASAQNFKRQMDTSGFDQALNNKEEEDENDDELQAPYPYVTIRDAISDLPGFEYRDSGYVFPNKRMNEGEDDYEDDDCSYNDDHGNEYSTRWRKQLEIERAQRQEEGRAFLAKRHPQAQKRPRSYIDDDYQEEGEEQSQGGGRYSPRDDKDFWHVDGTDGESAGVTTRGVGFLSPVKYSTLPQSEYQRCIRAQTRLHHQSTNSDLNTSTDKVEQHFTPSFNAAEVNRIRSIKMAPSADYRTMPQAYRIPSLVHETTPSKKPFYGRLDFNRHFPTVTTTMSPTSFQGRVIHPNQDRVLSVRECARAQGFPDDFLFDYQVTAEDDRSESASYSSVSPSLLPSRTIQRRASTTTTISSSLSSRTSSPCPLSEPRRVVGYDVKSLYKQIGNAVSPPLAKALGDELRRAMMKHYSAAASVDNKQQ